MEFLNIESGPEIEEIRGLFLEYAQSLNFSLCFQNFDKELRDLPGDYALPHGRLILCQFDGKAAGCVALKRLEPQVCEMKRLYVRPEFRGHQIGRKLALHLIEEARRAGYTAMRLDTVRGTMDPAIGLYRSLGFKEIPAYYKSPIPDALFLELDLRHAGKMGS
jgi:ribosomal protein S18 acetylase RimI-like enzyme